MNTVLYKPFLPAMSQAAIDRVTSFEKLVSERLQELLPTKHVLHGGLYARTICLKKGCVMVGALIKVPTCVMVSGDATVLRGDDEHRVIGYQVLAAYAGRKQAFIAHQDTDITMVFATKARTVEEAEIEFTDDHERLMSRINDNEIFIGELPCQEH